MTKRNNIKQLWPGLNSRGLKSDKDNMARNETAARVLRALHFLETSRNGLTISELKDKLENDGYKVSYKTVGRDIDCISMAMFPLIPVETDKGKRWKLDKFTTLNNNITFSYKEIFSHYVARKYLSHLKGSPLYEELDKFFVKLEKVFGTNCEAFNEFEENMAFKSKVSWYSIVPPEVMDTVYNALEEGHSLQFEYEASSGDGAGKWVTRNVGPESLYFEDAGVYLLAYDFDRKEPRTFALSRMKNVVDFDEKPYDKKGLKPGDFFKNSFGVLNSGDVQDVEIFLQGPVANYIAERKWHDSQTVIRKSSGVQLRMTVKVNEEFVRWVLSLGSGAQVLSPEGLKNSVVELATEILENYKNKAA